MKVKSFMIPAEKVITCMPDDTLGLAISKMMEHNIGSIIVVPPESDKLFPLGIVTKTDLLRGWQQGLDLNDGKLRSIMGTIIEKVRDTDSKDMAAEHFEKTKHRHAFVVDKDDAFVGIVSALDIAVECSKDSKAWPYMNRDELAAKYAVPESPTCATKAPVVAHAPHTFLDIAGKHD